MRSLILTLALSLTLAGAALAQSFSGTYNAKFEDNAYTLKLQQDKEGKVIGTLAEGGTELQIEGKVEAGKLVGTATLKGTPVKFFLSAKREAGKLILEVTEAGDDGKPDKETTEKITFDAPAGGTIEPEDKATPAKTNPLAKGAAAPSDPFVGLWKSKDLAVDIKGGSGQYKGTLTLDGKAFPFTSRKDGPGMSGEFTSGTDKFEFLAKIEGEALQLKTGDTVYVLLREGGAAKPANPLEKPKPSNPLAKKGEAGAKTDGADRRETPDKVFRHPVGLTVRYPKEWTLKVVEGSTYVLLPPGAGQDELYILGGTSVPGVTRADDPRAAQAADAAIAQLGSALQRKGPGEPMKVGDQPGMIFTYEGGPNGRARIYAIIHKEHAVALTAIGNKEKVDGRDAALRKIFGSFVLGEGERDAAIVGAWRNVGTRSIDARDNVGRLQASSVGESQRTVILRPDGTCTAREWSRTIAGGSGVFVDTGDQVTTKNGKWYAGSGKLILAWDNSAEEYDYRVVGQPGARQVVLKLDEKRESIWDETR
jgi:hypothetical protein